MIRSVKSRLACGQQIQYETILGLVAHFDFFAGRVSVEAVLESNVVVGSPAIVSWLLFGVADMVVHDWRVCGMERRLKKYRCSSVQVILEAREVKSASALTSNQVSGLEYRYLGHTRISKTSLGKRGKCGS